MNAKDIPPLEKHDVAFHSGRFGPPDATCARCNHRDQGGDLRTLSVACLYALDELDIPWEARDARSRDPFCVTVCKRCRADFIGALRDWYKVVEAEPSPGSGIYVRRDGHNVEISEEEWYRLNPGRKPVRTTDVKLPGMP